MIIFEKLQPLHKDFDPAEANANARISMEMGFAEALGFDSDAPVVPDDLDCTIALVNPGPSARTEDSLALLNSGYDLQGNPMKVVLCNAGYGMLERGLKRADAFVSNLPGSSPAKFPTFGDMDIPYYLASMCPAGADPENPSVFDHLVNAGKGDNIRLWHAHFEGCIAYENRHSVGTGSGAPVAALALFAAVGYKRFAIFGMDGSSEYAVDLGDPERMKKYVETLKQEEVGVRVGQKVFTATRAFLPQTREIMNFLREYPEAVQSIRFSGDTANAALFNDWHSGVDLDSKLEVLDVPSQAGSGPIFDPV